MIKIPTQSVCNAQENRPPVFNTLSDEEYTQIRQNKIIVKYRPNETIIKQNSRATQALIIIDGYARVFINDHNNKDLIIKYLREKDFFGISGLYNKQIYFYSVSAVEECTACFIDYDILKKIINNNIDFSEKMIEILCKDKIFNYNKNLCLTQKQSPGKAANAILYLHHDIFKRTDKKIIATRNDIAALTGMTNDNAGRILKDFNLNKLINFDGKQITLIDIPKLENISMHG